MMRTGFERFRALATARWVLPAASLLLVAALRPPAAPLRVCADPNNMPFSNQQGEGFENKIAELIAADWGTTVSYTWWRQMRGFLRNTLRAGDCDVVMGVPKEYDAVLVTEPYYRSNYVFVYRKDSGFEVTSLDDSVLQRLRIGVNLIGDDYANPPPAHALGARGITEQVRGYVSFYSDETPPNQIIDAVASGEIDIAVVWGPLAGYWAKREPVSLTLVSLPGRDELTGLPMAYDISMGVRRGDTELKARLEDVLHRKRNEITHILEDYGVPLAGVTRSTSPAADSDHDTRAAAPDASPPPQPAAPQAATPPARPAPVTKPPRPAAATQPAARPAQSAAPAPPSPPPATASLPADTPAVVSADVYQGWKWWHVYCFRCHGVDAIGANLAPDLRHSVTGTITQELFIQTATNGRPDKGMPPWNTLLNQNQLREIYLYVVERAEGRLPAGRPQKAQASQ